MDQEENTRRWRLSRRRFLQLAGAAGAATLVSAWVPRTTSVETGERPATHDSGASAPRLRQWMMIIDQRRCDGCRSLGVPPRCTEACIQGHFVPEPMEWIEVYEHEMAAEAGPRLHFHGDPHLPIVGTQLIPTPCMQCQNPPCVNVCPVGATWSTPEGVVLIDHDRCVGCRMCMAACPYERRFFTWGDPPIPPEALFVERNPEHQVPLRKGTVTKCDFCPEMAREGRLPFCIQACPHAAIYYGDLEEDVATNGEEVVKASLFLAANTAHRMKEQLGTRPRVYYIGGHGELVGRRPTDGGRLPVRWDWKGQARTERWHR